MTVRVFVADVQFAWSEADLEEEPGFDWSFGGEEEGRHPPVLPSALVLETKEEVTSLSTLAKTRAGGEHLQGTLERRWPICPMREARTHTGELLRKGQ